MIPIKSWCPVIEDKAKEQIANLANLPFAFHHVALMPDCHMGYGMPIGGVLATQGVVIPNAVGVDIGCGVYAIRFDCKASEVNVKKIMGELREKIPVGFEHHKTARQIPIWPAEAKVVGQQQLSAQFQLGTLGGGNHFLELQKDPEGYLWVMIHSGSRNLGKQVADHYNKVAIELNARWFSSVPKEHELAFLPIETREAKEYMAEMNYCVEFALANRKEMARVIKDSVNAEALTEINIPHNYARWEYHFGRDVIVHRKGATSAKLGEIGIIPGSQGTKSYIVKGLGNADSFSSCSHGAGRKMGRKEASRTLDLAAEIKRLDDQGIVHGIRHVTDLDEAAGAYKDIDEVMGNQKDLVEIVTELQPIGVIKG